MYPLHQSYILRLTTHAAPTLHNAMSWRMAETKKDSSGYTSDDSIDEERPSKLIREECVPMDSNASSEATLTSTVNDDNANLWDLRKNLENNIVVYLNENCYQTCKDVSRSRTVLKADSAEAKSHRSSMEPRAVGSSVKAPSRKKTQHLKDLKSDCAWYFDSCEEAWPEGLASSHVKGHRLECGAEQFTPKRPDVQLDTSPRNAFESSSSSVTPDSSSSEPTHRHCSANTTSARPAASLRSAATSSQSSVSEHLSNFTRKFRRPSSKRRMPTESFYGYSLERDFCVDSTTDRLFKEFLMPNPKVCDASSSYVAPSRNRATQLRRQLMRKQYSDSAAVYYGQRMRRWRMEKQRSDSVNCPIDRGVLRRQDQIREEYFPDEMEEDESPQPHEMH